MSQLSGAFHRAAALAAPASAGIDDSSKIASRRTPNMARHCSQIRDQPLHRRVLYLFSVSQASDIHLRYRLLVLLVDVADANAGVQMVATIMVAGGDTANVADRGSTFASF
jgi:hypothetical protein